MSEITVPSAVWGAALGGGSAAGAQAARARSPRPNAEVESERRVACRIVRLLIGILPWPSRSGRKDLTTAGGPLRPVAEPGLRRERQKLPAFDQARPIVTEILEQYGDRRLAACAFEQLLERGRQVVGAVDLRFERGDVDRGHRLARH